MASVPVIVGGVAYAVGCSNDADDSAKNFQGVYGTCKVDDNPCTEDCRPSSNLANFLPDGTVVEVGPGDAGPAPACQEWVCRSGTATLEEVDPGDPCKTAKGRNGHCAAGARCLECVTATDCSGKKAYCSNNECIACDDGLQNGNETGVDCGTTDCGRCNGTGCSKDGQCASEKCVDDVCCETWCTDKCSSCELDGFKGACKHRAFGTTDFDTGCTGSSICDGNGVCKLRHLADCQSGADCIGGICAGRCSNNNACSVGTDCNNGNCRFVCLGAKGIPCEQNEECGSKSCEPDAGACN